MHPLTWCAYFVSSIGAINWGLTTFFDYNLVDYLCSAVKTKYFREIVYGFIAMSGFYALVSLFVR